MNVTLHNDSYITPGYIFIAPYQTTNPGPYIYDNQGVRAFFLRTGRFPNIDRISCGAGGRLQAEETHNTISRSANMEAPIICA